MTRRWMMLIAVLGLMPTLLAMRPVDEALLNAAFKGDLGEVNKLIKREADVNAVNSGGFTPLIAAAEKGHQKIVALLLTHGAEVKQATTDNGTTPLIVAAENGHRATVALLLDKHADVTQARTDGKTPLFIAVEKEHPATVALLLDNGADVTQSRTDDGATALHIAVSQGHREIVTRSEERRVGKE